MTGWTAVARILRPRGNRGEVAAEIWTSSFARLERLDKAALFAGGRWPGGRQVEIERVWEHRGQAVFKFRGVDTMDAAEELRGAQICVPDSERPQLPEGEYYQSDLVGCEVVDRSTGDVLGAVRGVEEYGAAPLLEVEGEGGALLIPLARSICVRVDVVARKIEVELPEGLKDLNRR
jgi:16S rRNA processing protein RimM